jgi:hypothetical protein
MLRARHILTMELPKIIQRGLVGVTKRTRIGKPTFSALALLATIDQVDQANRRAGRASSVSRTVTRAMTSCLRGVICAVLYAVVVEINEKAPSFLQRSQA